jgi:hypothetical protein
LKGTDLVFFKRTNWRNAFGEKRRDGGETAFDKLCLHKSRSTTFIKKV